ncbi:MAG: hypothetical protein HMLKMBBP_00581 [Planctomycetes bacterium]|nr:hypothetical protein [Planctomycetota bacterium]
MKKKTQKAKDGIGKSGQIDQGHFVGRQNSKAVVWAWCQVPASGSPNPVFGEFWLTCGNQTSGTQPPAYVRPSAGHPDVSLTLQVLPSRFEGSTHPNPNMTDLTIPAHRIEFCDRCNLWYREEEGLPGIDTNASGTPAFGRKVLLNEGQGTGGMGLTSPALPQLTPGRLTSAGVYAVEQPDHPSGTGSQSVALAWVWRTGLPAGASPADAAFDRDIWLLTKNDGGERPFFARPGASAPSVTLRFLYKQDRPTGVGQNDFKANPTTAIAAFREWVFQNFASSRKPDPNDSTKEVSRIDLADTACLQHLRPWAP